MSLPVVARRHPLQERIAAVILEAAARTLARGGDRASMQDVAVEAGVARATLYRYFPSRQALVDEVGRLAANDAGSRLRSARLDQVPLEEGVARAVRALVEVGDLFIVLARERVRPDPDVFEVSLGAPLRGLVERGQNSGGIRNDVPSAWLIESLVGLVVSVLSTSPSMGREDTIAIATSLFLEGATPKRHQVE
ncbi:MAG: TetR/AcrR family transcriptional regulator [Actinomycetota bacterium]|nr:TetR/AcrR family transcriptional regulator [Actinomycetota bacterium]